MISKELEYALTKCRSIPYVKGQARVYSVIRDKRGKIVSESANDYGKTDPKMAIAARRVGLPQKEFCHAEQRCIARDKAKKGYKIYVARIDAKGNPMPAYPCPICRLLIKEHSSLKSIECTL